MKHPDIARRWTREYGSGRNLPQHKMKNANPESESQETWKKGVERLQRKPGEKRDFGMLHPSPSARHKPAGPKPNEMEATQEQGVQYLHGSRHREFGAPQAHKGLRLRDTNKAFGHPSIEKG